VGVEIIIFDDANAGPKGQILLEITAAGEALDISYPIRKATQDFTGEWRVIDEYLGSIYPGDTDPFNRDFEPGDYAVLLGSPDFVDENLGLNTVFVPKQEWRTTLVRASLGVLEVGVLSAEGEALQDELVFVARQAVDVTGNPVEAEDGGDTDFAGITRTDGRGIADLALAEGTYVVSIFESPSSSKRYLVFDVQVEAGQRQRIIVTRP